MSTATVNAAISRYIDSQDAVYATCDAGAALGVSGSGDTTLEQTSNSPVDNLKYILRPAYYLFDLFAAGLTSASIVTVATFSIVLEGFSNATLNSTIEVAKYDFGASVDTGDWRTAAQLAALTQVCDAKAFNIGATVNTRYSFTSVAAMLTEVANALAGDGKLRLMSFQQVQRQGTSTEFPDRRRTSFYSTASSGNEPQLDLTYTTPSGPANLKSHDYNLTANIRSIDGNLIANVKSVDTIV